MKNINNTKYLQPNVLIVFMCYLGFLFHILTFFYDVRHSNNVKKSEDLLFSVIGQIWGKIPWPRTRKHASKSEFGSNMLKITYLDIQECVQAFIAQSNFLTPPSEPPPCETTVYPNLTWPDLTKLWKVITMPPFEISNLSNIPKKSSFHSAQYVCVGYYAKLAVLT